MKKATVLPPARPNRERRRGAGILPAGHRFGATSLTMALPEVRAGRPHHRRSGVLCGAGILPALLAVLAAATGSGEVLRIDAEAAAARAVAASDVLAGATARRDGAQAAVASADAARLPSVAASAALTQRSAVPEFAAALAGPGQPPVVLFPNIETTYAAALQTRQVLYAGGAVDAVREASRHDLDASDAARRQVLADLGLAARLAYWEAVRAEASLEAALVNEQRAQRLQIDTQALRSAGMAVNADVLAAEARIASAHVAVIRAQTRRLDALSALRSLLHVAAGDDIALADRLTRSLPPEPAALADLTAEALAQRPELAAVTAQRAALAARERIVLAPARPSVAMLAQWELSRPNQRFFPLADEWNDSWSAGITASWTLFDGGRAHADARGSQAAQRAVEAQRAETARTVALEVEIARQGLLAALGTIDAADAARAASEERERASRERLDAGLAPMVEMLDAQSELATAEQQQIDVRATAWIADARLGRALGR